MPLPLASEKDKMGDVFTNLGCNWDEIPFEFPPNSKKEIQATPISIVANKQDKLI